MKLPRINLQWFMVAIVFFAIFLWAEPLVVPEGMRRWHRCRYRSIYSQQQADRFRSSAAELESQSRPEEAAAERRVAESCSMESLQYRRALFIPWQFWRMGDL